MEIRSVTLFVDPTQPPETADTFFAAAREAFTVPVQTTRLATTPFPDWWEGDDTEQAQQIASTWQDQGADYVSLGPVQLHHEPDWIERLPAIFAATDVLFATAAIADTQGNVDTGRCRQAARLIQEISTILDNGFGNLYFAALAHCPPGSPFFPVAYQDADQPAHFALAVETADLALNAIGNSSDLQDARRGLVTAIEQAAADLTRTADSLGATHRIAFSGIDFSLAPYPDDDKSLGGALEALGLAHVGAPGSLFAAALVADAIDRADFHRTGFSGLMLPVLEDSVLARRAAAGVVGVQQLLAYSAVCGIGLDTIPLPGDISEASLTGILLDVAALAGRLRKPLTARLMPLPGLSAGDPVQFDFPYFADSRVMAAGPGVGGALMEAARLEIGRLLR